MNGVSKSARGIWYVCRSMIPGRKQASLLERVGTCPLTFTPGIDGHSVAGALLLDVGARSG